jgi:CspA family cold shock protein
VDTTGVPARRSEPVTMTWIATQNSQTTTEKTYNETFVSRIRFLENECGTLNRVLVPSWVAMANGKVDFFNDTGGYGFIATDDSDDDVFFHMEDVGGEDLTEGTEIEFDIQQAPKGPRATNVVRV